MNGSKRSLLLFGLGLMALGLAASPAPAAVEVGDQPQLQFKSVDGTSVDLKKLKGKIVIVDFWATWCGPCMEEAGHMVAIHEKYGPKGLQMIGVSLDGDKATMIQVAKASGFNWPQYFDGLGWDNKLWATWGESGIPFTVLIGPDGKVQWKGMPQELDGPIEKAFRETPPQLVDPKVLAQATELLGEIDEKMKGGDTKAAIKLMAKVPAEAKADADFATKAGEVQKALEEEADKMLAGVQPLIEKGEFVAAIARLKELNGALAGLPVAAKAKKQITELMAKPQVKAKVEAAEKAARADEALIVAQGLKKDKKNDLAYARFKAVVKDFPGTPAAATAAAAAKQYEKNPAFVKRVVEKESSGKAKAALSMARSYKTAKKIDLARKKYQSVIQEFPGTPFADTARQELASLGK